MYIPSNDDIKKFLAKIEGQFALEKKSLIPILHAVQHEFSFIPEYAMQEIGIMLGISSAEVYEVATFYSFLEVEPKGKYHVALSIDMPSKMAGVDDVAARLEKELGIKMGETTYDRMFSLEWTGCVGISDMSPAMIINDKIFHLVTPDKASEIVKKLRAGEEVENELPQSYTNELTFDQVAPDSGLKKALEMSPQELRDTVKDSGLRGHGGAGFPTGMKWDFCAAAEGDIKHIVCNADEGEPGCFKDMLIFTRFADKVIEGMTIAGYAIGAQEGILYMRWEYAFLKEKLEALLDKKRASNMLGMNICGKQGVDFDIKLFFGAGAYVCGEETALIESIEGNRGEPRNKPPFPVTNGLYGEPTNVNNVETFAWVPCILSKGADWYKSAGTEKSKGYKLFSVSGDCEQPGVFEFAWGMTLNDIVRITKAENPKAIQVGGYSGQLVPASQFDRVLSYEDLATGGSVIIYGQQRNLYDIADNYLEFFIEESCGQCTPCRWGNQVLLNHVDKMRQGKVTDKETKDIKTLCETMVLTSKCGLGQTSPNVLKNLMNDFADQL